MKQYIVDITDEALADMDQLYYHIAVKLQAPENAMKQTAAFRNFSSEKVAFADNLAKNHKRIYRTVK